ncbi:MAG: hypothetical protein OXU43_07895 [Gammaproteobacteria bacterium]|nr:hypothetical protein [Gammaproteobacteria bacterium]
MTTEKDLTFAPSRRTFKIHVGKYGGIRVDAGEFFADPKVKRQVQLMRKTKLAGKKLDFRRMKRAKKN